MFVYLLYCVVSFREDAHCGLSGAVQSSFLRGHGQILPDGPWPLDGPGHQLLSGACMSECSYTETQRHTFSDLLCTNISFPDWGLSMGELLNQPETHKHTGRCKCLNMVQTEAWPVLQHSIIPQEQCSSETAPLLRRLFLSLGTHCSIIRVYWIPLWACFTEGLLFY